MKEKKLPSKEQFYSKLNDTHVSDEEYANAKRVCDALSVKNLWHFMLVYLKLDVCCFTDIFKNFRTAIMRTHKLDPLGYVSLSGYAWDTALFHSVVKVQLITDIEQMLLIEKSKRGGLAQCSKRYCVANNQYTFNMDKSKPDKYI